MKKVWIDISDTKWQCEKHEYVNVVLLKKLTAYAHQTDNIEGSYSYEH